MDLSFIRRLIAFFYTLVILVFIGLGFCYSNESGDYYKENTVLFNDYWTVDGKIITFPYSNSEEFTISNTLPTVYGDQLLVIRAYYEDFSVAIDGDVIMESTDNYLFDHITYVGKKEIWIPLKPAYTGSTISIKIQMQESLYGSELTDAFITTRSAYGINQMETCYPSVILFVVFTVTGIIEIFVSAFFIVKRTALIRKLTFEALFYAGAFSIIAGQWIINETRIPFIVFGHMTGFSVLNIISFLLMPLLFFEIARALFFKIGKVDNIIDSIIALTIVVSCFFVINGVLDWGHLVYVAHILDFIVMIMVGYYSYSCLKDEHKVSARSGIALANCLFLALAGVALVQYINNVDSNYIVIVMIDLMIFIMVQVGLIYRRIGLNVREEKEFAEAKIFAFTDELTKLGNRRHFYNVVDDYEKSKLPADLTYIAIDVNRLKYYNDTIGHDAGDELLIGTAKCLKKAFSTSSTATIGRLGGDEFGVLLVANKNEVERRLDSFKNYLSKWHGKKVNGISVSVGYAAVREDLHSSVDSLAKTADERMYEDKRKYYEATGFDRRSPQ